MVKSFFTQVTTISKNGLKEESMDVIEKNETVISNGKVICGVSVYENEKESIPMVYLISLEENGDEIIEKCNELKSNTFNLTVITLKEWNEYLSPWESENIISEQDNFSGKADVFLDFILKDVISYTECALTCKPSLSVLVGYSMAGLFSLYSMYKTEQFDRVASVSGSLWYPKFFDFVKKNKICVYPEKIYLSLGDKESKTSNGYLKINEFVTQEIYSRYASEGIKCEYEINPGNHFNHVADRIAKGVKWLLE